MSDGFLHERVTDVHPYLTQHFSENGDGTGAHDLNVDGSGKEVLRFIGPPATGRIVISHFAFVIEAQGNFQTETFASLATLTNGVRVGIYDTLAMSWRNEWTATHRITRNLDWSLYAHDVQVQAWGGGRQFLSGTWEVKNGVPLMLESDKPYALAIGVYDDLSTLSMFEAVVEGYRVGRGLLGP